MELENADLRAGLEPTNPGHTGHLGAGDASYALVLTTPEGRNLIEVRLSEAEAFRVITFVEAARAIEKGQRRREGVHGKDSQKAAEVSRWAAGKETADKLWSLLPNDYHPGIRCSCESCLRNWP